MKDFAKRLVRLRERAGMSRQQLADRSGISTSYLSRLEAGLREPHLSVLLALAHALGVALSAFDTTGGKRE